MSEIRGTFPEGLARREPLRVLPSIEAPRSARPRLALPCRAFRTPLALIAWKSKNIHSCSIRDERRKA